MPLTFPADRLAALLAEAEERWPQEIRERYEGAEPRGFWIVGDHGVFAEEQMIVCIVTRRKASC